MTARVRVAVTELRTAVYRAYVAEGASSGEAEAAGEAAARGETVVGGGLRLAVAGLGRIPRERVGAAVAPGSPAVLVDPAGRAPLLRLRMALDWLGAVGEPIAVPDVDWSDAIAAALPVGVAAVGPACGAACDGGIALFDGDGGLRAGPPGGVLVQPGAPTSARERIEPDEVDRRMRAAGARGLEVDAAAWDALEAVAARYLVPEAPPLSRGPCPGSSARADPARP